MPNMPICTHLSNHIFPNQFSFGNAEPGIVNRNTERMIHKIAGTNEGFIFFNVKISAILNVKILPTVFNPTN